MERSASSAARSVGSYRRCVIVTATRGLLGCTPGVAGASSPLLGAALELPSHSLSGTSISPAAPQAAKMERIRPVTGSTLSAWLITLGKAEERKRPYAPVDHQVHTGRECALQKANEAAATRAPKRLMPSRTAGERRVASGTERRRPTENCHTRENNTNEYAWAYTCNIGAERTRASQPVPPRAQTHAPCPSSKRSDRALGYRSWTAP